MGFLYSRVSVTSSMTMSKMVNRNGAAKANMQKKAWKLVVKIMWSSHFSCPKLSKYLMLVSFRMEMKEEISIFKVSNVK
jgi:hypothetical protein